MRNPFMPTFGATPPLLVGRDRVITPAGRGRLRFTHPVMGDWLRTHALSETVDLL